MDSVKINDTIIKTNTNLTNLKDKKIKLGIRSEFIKIANDQKENSLNVDVDKVEDLGNYKLLTAKMGNLIIKSKLNREKLKYHQAMLDYIFQLKNAAYMKMIN